MKRKTRYDIKFVVETANSTEKYHREFSTIKNVRSFVKKFQCDDLLYCWRDVTFGNKECVRMDSYFSFDPMDGYGKYWHKLNRGN